MATGEPCFKCPSGRFERDLRFLAFVFVANRRALITYNYTGAVCSAGTNTRPKKRRCYDDDADYVSVYSACRAGGAGDGRVEYERQIRHSGFGFDGF